MMMIMRSRLKSSFAIYPTCCSLHANMQFTRPRCGCRCECSRIPNRRSPCTICHHLIGLGCCATEPEIGAATSICHCCSEANPQEVDGATIAIPKFCGDPHALSRSDMGFDSTCIVCEYCVNEIKQTFDLSDTDSNGSIEPSRVTTKCSTTNPR